MSSNNINDAIDVLKEKKRDLEEQLKGIELSIKVLEENKGFSDIFKTDKNNNSVIPVVTQYEKDVYDSRMTSKMKFVYFLDKLNRFVHFREIAEMIIREEGKEYNISDLASTLSSSTQSLKKKGLLVKFQAGKDNRNTFWGKKNWLTPNGEIKPGFEFNENYLYTSTDLDLGLFQ
ncbi:hypothetical protein [Elizabethkingia meningoseptica]|uniref:hypothetical protein n=1 Tax=Elizabethkingia meningoseptica TaxID=238 RepID=UPI000937BE35|nr:hypothetical protein [Elizabethkingia meningoseptica]MDE5488689.1 hypothetical protein [Elizabethkingia meningoseptica]MVW93524.1 hypothetical protein [Elizabethkingia meningoseptica]